MYIDTVTRTAGITINLCVPADRDYGFSTELKDFVIANEKDERIIRLVIESRGKWEWYLEPQYAAYEVAKVQHVEAVRRKAMVLALVLSIFGASRLNQRNTEKLVEQFEKRIEQRLGSIEQRLDRMERQLEAVFKPILPPRAA